jgi:enolase
MAIIENIIGREILDSRGNPTIEVDVVLKDGAIGTSAAPSGASTGEFEAHELRDNNPLDFHGKGVSQAVALIKNIIGKELIGLESTKQEDIDQTLIDIDGTPNKSKLGANTMLAVSLATSQATAISKKTPLYKHLGNNAEKYTIPVPLLNIINGGRHASDSTDIQEFMIIPANFHSFYESIKAGSEVYHHLNDLLKSKGLNTNVGDEGGFAPKLQSNESALELIINAIEKAGYKPGLDFFIGLDVAASEIYNNKTGDYNLNIEKTTVSTDELIIKYSDWVKQYPIISIEDGLNENDWNGWVTLTKKLGDKCQLVGDDLFTTNTSRIKKGLKEKAANSVLIKPNQIGTLTETLDAIEYAKNGSWGTIISHRSGETEHTFISDLAVGTNAGQIKSGAPARGERTAKYNQILRIEQQLGSKSYFGGLNIYEKYYR